MNSWCGVDVQILILSRLSSVEFISERDKKKNSASSAYLTNPLVIWCGSVACTALPICVLHPSSHIAYYHLAYSASFCLLLSSLPSRPYLLVGKVLAMDAAYGSLRHHLHIIPSFLYGGIERNSCYAVFHTSPTIAISPHGRLNPSHS